MKVALVHTDLRLYWPARINALAEVMRAAGDDLRVMEIAGGGSNYDFARPNLKRPEWWEQLFPDRRMEHVPARMAWRAVRRRLDAFCPDAVIAGSIAFPSGSAAAAWCVRRRKACVIFDDARKADVPRTRAHEFVKRRIYANVGAVLIPAQSHSADFESWGVPGRRHLFGVDVVDNEALANAAEDARRRRESALRELELPDPFFLGVGRQVPVKNWRTLVRAFGGYAAGAGKGAWSLVLVGNGTERRELEALAAGISGGRIKFVDFVSQKDIPAYYGLARALVLPSSNESWGLVVNEAMACGLPVLVSEGCGCARTLVFPGRNGATFDPRSENELAQVLTDFAALPEDALLRMGQASKGIISEWGLDRFVRGAMDAVRYAVENPPRSPGLAARALLSLWKGRYRPL